MTSAADSVGLLLCDDFMWISRIVGTAQSLGLKLKAARTVDQLEKLAAEQRPVCIILDLSVSNIVPADVVTRLQSAGSDPARWVAFGSHVDVDSLRAAREAGCDPVLPRSAFAEKLPDWLREWLAGRG